MKDRVIYALILVLFIILVLWAKNGNSETLADMYNNEFIEFIEIDGKLLPEHTKFKCANGILYKNKQTVRMYTGDAKTCKTVFIRRADREKNYDTTNLF